MDGNSKRTAKLFSCLSHVLERHFLPEFFIFILGTKFELVLDFFTTFEEGHEELYVFFSIFNNYALYLYIQKNINKLLIQIDLSSWGELSQTLSLQFELVVSHIQF